MLEVRTSEAFKTNDAASYDTVTQEFDRFTERFSTPLARRMVSLARLEQGQCVLDVGTGTSVVATQAALTVGPHGRVVGIDLSEKMVKAAREKAALAGLADRATYHVMDAERLGLGDSSFDAAFSLFALLHFPNPLQALGEMFRVLRPGGIAVIGVGSRPPLFSLTGLLHRIRRLPELVFTFRHLQLTAPHYLNHLVEKFFPAHDEPEESTLAQGGLNRTSNVPALIRLAGFTIIRTCWEGHVAVIQNPEEFWDIQRTFSSIARKRLLNAADEKVRELRREFMETCQNVQRRGGRLIYPSAAFFVCARKPSAER
jgi:ubiquinone/menaquinone biosynthesis C-methylase UbiE